MRRAFLFPFFLSFCLILACYPVLASSNEVYSENIENAVSWLKEGYNSTIGLIRENHLDSSNPDRENNYWLFSDNFLAYMVLSKYDRDLGDKILNNIHINGYYQNYKHSAYFRGYKIRFPPYGALQTGGYEGGWFLVNNITGSEIWLESYTNATIEITDYENYISWLLPKVLTLFWENKLVEARNLYNELIDTFWDGKGFLPLEYGKYVTWKLGSVLYVGLRLYSYDWQISNTLKEYFNYWRALLWNLQKEDGGLPTHYKADLTTVGVDSNTETTCFGLLHTTLNVVDIKEPIVSYGGLMILGIVLILVMKYWRKAVEAI